jgi:hypothetical protein
VLAGVDHERVKLRGATFHGGDDRRHFHEIRPRADDVYYFEHLVVLSSWASYVYEPGEAD